jgi:hypothetical protein
MRVVIYIVLVCIFSCSKPTKFVEVANSDLIGRCFLLKSPINSVYKIVKIHNNKYLVTRLSYEKTAQLNNFFLSIKPENLIFSIKPNKHGRFLFKCNNNP